MRKRVIFLVVLLLSAIIIYLNASLLGLLQAMSMHIPAGSRQTDTVPDANVIRLALIYKGGNQFWQLVREGAQAATTQAAEGKQSVYLRTFDSAESGQFSLQDSLQLAILARYDGIIIHAEDEDVVPLIRRAGEAGIPVIVVISDLPGSGRISYVGTNNYRAGFAAGKAMLRAFNADSTSGRGSDPVNTGLLRQFAILSATSGRDRQMSVAESLKVFGFREAVSSVATNDIAVWEKCEPTVLESVAVVRRLLEEHPGLDGIFVTHAAGTLAAAQVVVEKGLAGRVKIVGFGDQPEIRSYIAQDIITAAIVEYPYEIGYTAVREMLLYLNEGRVNVFNNIDGRILTKDNVFQHR